MNVEIIVDNRRVTAKCFLYYDGCWDFYVPSLNLYMRCSEISEDKNITYWECIEGNMSGLTSDEYSKLDTFTMIDKNNYDFTRQADNVLS